MTTHCSALLCSLGLVIGSSSLFAKEVKVCTLDEYPPFTFAKDKGVGKGQSQEMLAPGKDSKVLQGYSWDVVRQSYHKVGYNIELTVTSWARCMKLVADGNADLIFPASRNAKREKDFIFSKEAVDRSGFVVYVKKGTPLDWKGLDSLNGKSIHVMRGWSYGSKFEEYQKYAKKTELNDSIEAGLKMLKKGRIKYLIGYDIAFDYQIRKMNLKDLFSKTPAFDHADEFMMGSKTNERVIKRLEAFDEGKKKIEAEGQLKAISSAWM